MLAVSFPLQEEPEDVFRRFAGAPGAAVLASGSEPRPCPRFPLARWSFVAVQPFLVLSYDQGGLVANPGVVDNLSGHPLHALEKLLAEFRLPAATDTPVPFPGGAVGYLSYELRTAIERVPARGGDVPALPHLYFAFYDATVAIDHHRREVWIISTGLPEKGSARTARARLRYEELRRWFFRRPESEPQPHPRIAGPASSLVSSFTRPAYLAAVRRVKEYIAAGDVYQVNLSQRFSSPAALPAFPVFLELLRTNPVPFAAYFSGPGFTVVSSSPERFLHFDAATRVVHTRPIKGTRPRGNTPEADGRLARELLQSEKDRAEHVMIVDLERNDLGRVAEAGSVGVPEFCVLEPFPTVHHLTSTVEARLPPETGVAGLLRATFPGGSITGAPKIRAMEIIDEIEPVARGIYTGAIGYFGFNGNLDLNIAIRTMVLTGNGLHFHVGGGIVWDSDPEQEYQETLDKAAALFRAIGHDDKGGVNCAGVP
ncbi:MAG: aminodeoxychorismate synthase component I [Thermoanaerobacterales bacterium]|nr:aminodeoxychorismate synthase component I [Thermoanaerobacterales bacterium]